jgi:Ni/Co efflux regulator RcnB
MSKKLLYLLCAALLLTLGPTAAFAQHDNDDDRGHGNGHAYGHGKHDRGDDRDHDRGHGNGERRYYHDHDRELHDWYQGHRDHLPPGLAKRDELPPGLERQLVARGTLPPGLRSRMHPCPVEVESFLPPPPPGYMHTVIGGHVALVNRKTFFVLDVFHFEM